MHIIYVKVSHAKIYIYKTLHKDTSFFLSNSQFESRASTMIEMKKCYLVQFHMLLFYPII